MKRYSNNRTNFKQTSYEAGAIFFVSFFIAILLNQIRPNSISFFPNSEINEQKKGAATEISVAKALLILKNKKGILLDARPATIFEEGHIPGALNFYEKDFDELVENFLLQNESKTIIITYCDGRQCDLARSLSEKFCFVGYEKVFYIEDGWSRWKGEFKDKK
ncbi:MAG TPA: hypothetical protein DD405_06160 [Desulfobacteraceae bacterium]|nr:hypothetical protein [Desulfobacteraceae bacterium]